MPTPYESATLNLRLFELRRDPELRQARTWFLREFAPRSADDFMTALRGPRNAWIRMVTGYWDMAASNVTHGAIDAAMFLDAHGEIVATLAKVHPFLAELRAAVDRPDYLRHVEQVVTATVPDADRRLRALHAMLAAAADAAATAAADAAVAAEGG